ncbi:MAG TPA: thioredoxin-disulfide reductase [Kiritimatiellia bacterium]|nr:thioredoxin-disulfide reductase [Kiritimatiellia bacterium]HNR94313.1 thioredoxin-disulfide reductase [Kiritimatiellia bacterium]HNS80703.1 thioredoxin-disulfide reductase [Kiritimatiellia bacterium]HPA77276.1 thioredoxin-disulfide reductase [Kiritimatiellia bacterium]HQQ03236.1 thioredoxin-disulfide reductase [Kiritimatiellia bacterium]
MTRNMIILGTGPAGLTAAIYAARARLEPLVVEGMQPGGQLTSTTDIENYPGFENGIGGFELMDIMKRQAVRFGTDFVSGTAVSVDFKNRPLRITLSDGSVHETETLIIATGASARYLGLESEQKLMGKGVSGCATCDGAFFRDVPVAVIGGGDTATEEALFLTRFASKVYIIHRRDQLRASRIMADRVLSHAKIEMVWNSVVEDVLDVAQDKVTALRLKNVKTGASSELPVEGMFLGIGHQPNTEPFKGHLKLNEQGYIITQETSTDIEGVYAAGDVQDPHYRQAVTAAGSGCMAALKAERYLEEHGF